MCTSTTCQKKRLDDFAHRCFWDILSMRSEFRASGCPWFDIFWIRPNDISKSSFVRNLLGVFFQPTVFLPPLRCGCFLLEKYGKTSSKNPSGKDLSGMSHPKPLSCKISNFEQNQLINGQSFLLAVFTFPSWTRLIVRIWSKTFTLNATRSAKRQRWYICWCTYTYTYTYTYT